jgi:hypothetical protein
MRIPSVAALALLALPLAASAQIYDDFNDGNDTGWTRFSPLTAVGAPATYSFPGANSYRIQSPASPNPATFGAARAGSFRATSYTDFFQAVDIVNWDPSSSDMVMGMVARASQIGLGSTDGYISILETDGNVYIFSITNEAPSALPIATSSIGVPLDLAKDYRMTFSGQGNVFTTQIYNLTDNILLSTISGSDGLYASGTSGVFAFDGSDAANRTVDATFDNYLSAVPEPASTGMLIVGAVGLLARRSRKSALVQA